jgi:RHS repeat-associated protein
VDLGGPWSGHSGIVYDDAGRKQSQTLPNNAVTTWGYDGASRLRTVEHKTGAGTVFACYGYTYDDAGNRRTQTDYTSACTSGGTTKTFTYDGAHRLTSEARPGQPTDSYGYDPAGNRTSATVNGVTRTFVYDDDNRLVSISDGTIFQYDQNGSLTRKTDTGGITDYTYDGVRRLTDVAPPGGNPAVHFTYDGDGARLKKRVGPAGSAETSYVNDTRGLTQVLQETGPDAQGAPRTLSYVPGLLQHDSSLTGAAAWSYFHGDAQNHRVLTDGNQAVSKSWEFDPFGVIRAESGSATSAFGYAGEQRDGEAGLGLLNLRARYYDPKLGRFLSRDDRSGWVSFPQSHHVSPGATAA